ncbi:sulfotransferase family 2 domain-containing protein [Asticcacaulis endophyticus]|uniref:sulfotransferase family 2 domain-containing protein n=1 Tax=Asticcacaulis endophyticus TaxID=1395890 RepID=UPI001675C290|nr:sulfotransferase family 2 domain-containing protein [Asticcacaulis endophyticus]
MPKLRTAFYHINKCAGTTILNYLLSMTKSDFCLRLEDFPTNDFGLRKLRQLDPVIRARFIHDPSGMTDWNAALGNTLNLTWLRDPVDRAASQINMISRWTDEEASNEKLRTLRDAAKDGIAAYLNAGLDLGYQNIFNGITAYFQFSDPSARPLWLQSKSAGLNALESRALEIALSNFEKMDFIGIVESFDAHFQHMCAVMGVQPPQSLQAHNVNPAKSRCTDEDRELLLPYVQLDMQIYNRALEKTAELPWVPAPPKAEYLTPPRGYILSGEDYLSGDGWHVCERNGHKISRWTGPGDSSALSLMIDKSDGLFMRLHVADFMHPEQVNALYLMVDGVKTGVNITPINNNGFIVEAWATPDQLDHSTARLDIAIHYGFSQKSKNSGDDRILGLEISEFEVGPLPEYQPDSILNLSRWVY